jgi:hypothetical protein
MSETPQRLDPLFNPLDGRPTASAREVADKLGYDISAIQKLARQGLLPGAFQPRGKHGGWRFRKDVLEDWWAKKTGQQNLLGLERPKRKKKIIPAK